MSFKLKSSSWQSTQKIARLFAQTILEKKPRSQGALVLGLMGELGSGKTTFIRGFIKSFGIKKRITSPTFLIMRKFFSASQKCYLYHFDFYRSSSRKDLKILEFDKIIKNPQNIVLIEWAEKIKNLLPKNAIWLTFQHGKEINQRLILIKTKNK
ncbi:tRNA (adenosine(37)-N6)-threonylcarbamoyltransferase complex ATPase subunit type 1 TsaE [Candidatus Jorgensenbacteria bacterium CG_4_10_14_0_8_um_filter_39_13]|uniref:tRNA threonylcarbamoyladenosine biosynthesis protein TsaE n=2 Tax=Candidatus Joergenseniibacteriota TaxID=1752739 RepID=A0A2M7RGI0_9BACT|nr:MAG: tRNA (adenosine(37)-N6)-threonylcarbamoyltransferase complex ATPase subunit type 1 TsaE [Candidatus Jorgensenbacteria bacterium CG11_big_fil_rev_8_21_14_0_20_38_23]PIY95865.1 MAG: tRNA (adenosine(37)-N6)-threonylcarbamoyltransferase complex ATPase subunit type 1 TsaE [Candidatus Jorgensenbacteria bacterium CG_4_10_14_0_8_um_filter_39_13]